MIDIGDPVVLGLLGKKMSCRGGGGEGKGEGEGNDLHRRSSGFGSSLKCHASGNFETISFILDSDYFFIPILICTEGE